MSQLRTLALLFCVTLPLITIVSPAQTFKFHSVGFVSPAAINSSGTIAGSFCCNYTIGFDGPQPQNHGFSLQLSGLSSPVFKVAEPLGSQDSFATGIAPNGDVVGGFCPQGTDCSQGAAMHGYRFSNASNSTSQIDVPGALATLAGGINQSGEIVGLSCNASTCSLDYACQGCHGFLLDHVGGSFSTIDFPGVLGTSATAINDVGNIVGNYSACTGQDSKGGSCFVAQAHGFLLSGGTYSSFDPPGSVGTFATAINNSGEIAGTYIDGSNKTHGFVLKSGAFSIIDFPGASLTQVTGVNDKGQIVGWGEMGLMVENFIGTPQ